LKTMEWDERVWTALKYAVTGMPVFVRKGALRKIVEASEKNAKERSSDVVQATDLVLAAREKVPKSVQGACFDALREYGIQTNGDA